MKLAFQRKMAYRKGQPKATNDRCPLCHLTDSAGHIFGGCAHKDMKTLYISRHDTAMRKVLKQISHGQLGAHYIIADVGTMESLEQLGAHNKRIPEFILHNSDIDDEEEQPSTVERDRMRPDIMIVEWTDKEREMHLNCKDENMPVLNINVENKKPRKVWIVEGGYCTDTRYTDKYKRKELQHQQLQNLLIQKGCDVTLMPTVLGVTGAVYKTNVTALSALGIDSNKAKKLLKELHLHAVLTHHTIIKLRRKLESTKMCKTKKQTKDTSHRFEPP